MDVEYFPRSGGAWKIGFYLPLKPTWRKAIGGAIHTVSGSWIWLRIRSFVCPKFDTLGCRGGPILCPGKRFETRPGSRPVFVPFVGINHLPSDLLIERNVDVFNCHGNAESVAERALALALAAYGRVIEYHNDLRQGKWHGFWFGKGHEDFWHSIFRKPCAVLGVGAIGTILARLLKAFDCPVTGYRRRMSADAPPCFDRVTNDVADAHRDAEIVFVACPHGRDGRILSRVLLAG
jgi:hypothetical protein